MSYSFRERLRMRLNVLIKKYNLEPNDLDWVEDHIEELCKEADARCEILDREKAADQVIDELNDEAFDKFAKGVIDEIKARLDKFRKLQKKKRKNVETEADYEPAPYVYPDENKVTENVQDNQKGQEIAAK